MTDEITLTLPRHKPFFRVAHLVLGGVAVRHDLTFESLEDLQLALAGLLEHPPEGEGAVTVAISVGEGALRTVVGPFDGERLRAALEREHGGNGLSLRRLLETVTDGVHVGERDGAEWVELTKTVEPVRR